MGAQFSDYEFGFRYGDRQAMDRTSYQEGMFNIATDCGSLSLDIDGKRIELTDIITGYSEVEIYAIEIPTTKIYLANDTFNLLVFDFAGGRWRRASAEVVLHAQMADQDGNGNIITTTYETKLDADATETTLRGLINNLQYQINSINKFDIVFLNPGEGLPNVGQNFVIYFVPVNQDSNDENPTTENRYVEYIWSGSKYEQIGLISVDLVDYYNKSETLSKTEINNRFNSLSYVEGITQSGNYATITTNKNGNSDINLGVMGFSVDEGFVTDNTYIDPNSGEEIDNKYIENTGKISLSLKDKYRSNLNTISRGNTENREYPLGLDNNGYLSVNIPWSKGVTAIAISDGQLLVTTDNINSTSTIRTDIELDFGDEDA